MNKNVRVYLNKCRRYFPFFGKKEKIFFTRFRDEILNYCDAIETFSYNDLEKRFGSPLSIYESYIKSCDDKYILKKMQINAILKKIMIILLISFIFISLFEFLSIIQIKNQKIIVQDEEIVILDKE